MRLVLALLVLGAGFCSSGSLAHESLPITIELEETSPSQYVIQTRAPGNVSEAELPLISLPAPCRGVTGAVGLLVQQCPSADRPGRVQLEWAGKMPATALLLRASFLNGEEHIVIADAGSTEIKIPKKETPLHVLSSYAAIGVEHILAGVNHLLFLLCLVLVSQTLRRTVLTVTGFTLGHALTISLASLDLIRVNANAVEALIALSIVFLAAELWRGKQDSVTMRYPMIIALLFGTLHGLGFAGALSEIGLAQTQVLASLVGFNVGVEIGQLIFVVLILLSGQILRRMTMQRNLFGVINNAYLTALGTLLIGTVSAFWFWQLLLGAL